MKLALLTKYGNLAASTRQRFEQYKPFLKDEGFEIFSFPLLDNNYLEKLYKSQPQNRIHIFNCYIKRLYWLFSKPDIDVIWLHKELFPYFPGFIEKLLSWTKKPIIFDYDDAIFHNYDMSSNKLIRTFLGKKLHSTIMASDAVFCGNNYLAEYAKPFCSDVEIIPTILDTDIFIPYKTKASNHKPISIGWIGTPSTWHDYMAQMIPMFENIAKNQNIKIEIMGAGKDVRSSNYINFHEWSSKKEIPFIQSLDIGIMPLNDSPWSRGKCGYKLIQYMACEVPVVASPVGVNCEIVDHGKNGYLAKSHDEWRIAIKTLINNSELRHQLGENGRKKIEKNYSLKVWGPRVARKLSSIHKELNTSK